MVQVKLFVSRVYHCCTNIPQACFVRDAQYTLIFLALIRSPEDLGRNMHSRLGRHGGHGHGCQHGGGHDRDSLIGDMGCRGLGGGRFHGSYNHCDDRDGERYGWGREGRVRLNDSPVHHRRPSSMGGLLGGLEGLNLGGGGLSGGRLSRGQLSGGGLGGGGRLLGGMGGLGGVPPIRYYSDGLGNRRNPFLEHGLEGGLMDPRDNPYLRQELGMRGMGMGLQDRLGGGRPILADGVGLGLGGGSRSPSLRGSMYSLDHLDRRSRPYHYQPPYVEDYDGGYEEELLEMLGRRDGLMQGADLYGLLPAGYDIEDLMDGMGGLGGRRGRL